ncbi:MAG: hypothetical protein V4695_04530 [Pseudomonadota bacterium]
MVTNFKKPVSAPSALFQAAPTFSSPAPDDSALAAAAPILNETPRTVEKRALREAMQQHNLRQPPQIDAPAAERQKLPFDNLPAELHHGVVHAPVQNVPHEGGIESNASIKQVMREDQHPEKARMAVENALTHLVESHQDQPDDGVFKNAVRKVLENKFDVGIHLIPMIMAITATAARGNLHEEENYDLEEGLDNFVKERFRKNTARCKMVWDAVTEKTDIRSLDVKVPECKNQGELNLFEHLNIWESLESVQQKNPGLQHFHLNMSNNRLNDDDATSLAKLTHLTSLDVRRSKISGTGLARLGALTNLESLFFSTRSASIGKDDIRALSTLVKLKSFDIEGVNFRALGGLGELSTTFKNSALITLRVSDCEILDEQITDFELPQLTTLDISNNEALTANGIEALARKFPELRSLNLGSNDRLEWNEISFAGFKKLVSLDLYNTSLNDTHVAKLATMPMLTELNIGGNRLTLACVQSLARLKQLKRLQLSTYHFSEQDLKTLAAALPDVEIIRPEVLDY